MSSVRRVNIFDQDEQLYTAVHERFVAACWQSIEQRGRFCVALAGGSTPRALYERLASESFGGSPADTWSRVELFWGDERHVPPDHAESNYRMVNEALLTRIEIPQANVHRFQSEEVDANQVAVWYESELRRVFEVAAGELPRFDLILLGMGGDGHTASLFPETAALEETERWVVANWVEARGRSIDDDRPSVERRARGAVFSAWCRQGRGPGGGARRRIPSPPISVTTCKSGSR